MKMSTKGRYGLRAMLELARLDGDGPVMLGTIAKRQNISAKYLHSLLTILRASGLVVSVRGANGGFALSRSANDIKLSEILSSLEGSFAPVDCVVQQNSCSMAKRCAVRQIYHGMAMTVEGYLDGITLQKLLENQRYLDTADHMYHI